MLKLPFFLILSLYLLGCSHVLYYPDKKMYTDIKKLEIPPQIHKIKNYNSDSIELWHFQSKTFPPKAVIVQFHGNAQNVSAHFTALYWALAHDFDFVTFDYPGYGGSEGVPTPESTVKTGIDVLKWTRKKYPNTPIVVFGQSLGGAIGLKSTLDAQSEVNPCLVTVESTFASYQGVGRDVLRQQWLTWLFQPLAYLLLSDEWAPNSKIKNLSPTPLVVMHSKKDPIVPFKMGQDVYNKAMAPKDFWETTGGHIDAFTANDRLIWQNRFSQKIIEACDLKK